MATRVQTFEEFVLADPEGRNWELHDGQVQEKPSMSAEHNYTMTYLGAQLISQLDERDHIVRVNSGHLRRLNANYFVPDVVVLPAHLERAQRRGPGHLEVYAEPLPLVVEVWSPSTGDFDVDTKLLEYQRRGDLEIWRLHAFDKLLTAYQRQPDGSYTVTTHHSGKVQPVALPDVTVDLDKLFRSRAGT